MVPFMVSILVFRNSVSTTSDGVQRRGNPQAITNTSIGGDELVSTPYDDYAAVGGPSSGMMMPPMNVDAVIVREQDIRGSAPDWCGCHAGFDQIKHGDRLLRNYHSLRRRSGQKVGGFV